MRNIVLVVMALSFICLVGCHCHRNHETGVSIDSYVEVLTKIKGNLEGNIRPTVADLLAADKDHGDEWKKAKIELLDVTIILCDDTLKGKKAGEGDEAEVTSGTPASQPAGEVK